MNLTKAVKVQVSSPPISVLKLHSETDKISFVGPVTFPKGEKGESNHCGDSLRTTKYI